MKRPCFELGMRFTNGNEFREAIRNFCADDGKCMKLKPSEAERIRVK